MYRAVRLVIEGFVNGYTADVLHDACRQNEPRDLRRHRVPMKLPCDVGGGPLDLGLNANGQGQWFLTCSPENKKVNHPGVVLEVLFPFDRVTGGCEYLFKTNLKRLLVGKTQSTGS